jgi:antitoxin (DNA-binding transcriptional repressor) of toxin-antitoxin stability system
MVRMSATEVARNFSAVVNRVIAGEEIEVIRNGTPVAELRPPSKPQRLSGEAWRKFVRDLPPVDPDFARELEETRKSLGHPVSKWPAG